MEQAHRIESHFQHAIGDGAKIADGFLPLLKDQNQFYEQLVSGCSFEEKGMENICNIHLSDY